MTKHVNDPASYIWDMLDEIDWINKYIRSKGDLFGDLVGKGALRAFTVLGEAAKRVDESVKNANTHIPWQKIIDTRNLLSHEYEDINLEKIWEIITDYLPDLRKSLLLLYKDLTGTDYHAH